MTIQILPRCQCCEKVPKQGLHDGIRIQGTLFCSSCCNHVASSLPDSALYQKFLGGLRKALFPHCQKV